MTAFIPRPAHLFTPSALALACGLLGGTAAQAQTPAPGAAWEQCRTLTDTTQRLACYDQWAGGQAPPASTGGVPAPMASTTPPAPVTANGEKLPVDAVQPATRVVEVTGAPGCKDDQYSDYSRFWELENGTDCGTFGIRGYRPMSLSWAAGSSVNTAPTSPAPGHNGTFTDYSKSEMRIQLSVRTKVAQGLLTQGDASRRDSVWFGYTQQSYWQLF
ncbi:MAG: phospholipase, partial [Lysobacteraceae bacterium]